MGWIALALLGCAEGSPDEASTVQDAAVAETSAPTDTGTRFTPPDGPMDAIFPVEDSALPKICDTPVGTTATASGSYMSTPELSVDRDVGTVWNSGDYLGWMRVKFPKPIFFDRVRVAANAVPACNITYTVHATGKLGEGTRAVTPAVAWLDPIEIAPGTYDEILIDVGRAESWITLAEVRVFDSTGGCP